MSRIEELSDEPSQVAMGEKIANSSNDGSMDDLFDRAMQNGGLTNKTFEEALLDISKTPLFMQSLDATSDENGNVMLEALQALQYEGPKSEVAQNFKEQGNECVAAKKWIDAKEFYSKGLAILTTTEEGKYEQPDDMENEKRRREILLDQLYSNRARCNLELKNYRSTTQDCAAALRINPNNSKAHYRSAAALLALDKVYEALDVCYRGLKVDAENLAMRTLLEKIQKRSRVKESQDRQRKEREIRLQREALVLATALKARGIRVRGSTSVSDMTDAAIKLSPDPLSPKSTVEFPVMLLYPMHNQSDFVKAYGEKDALADHLGYILPLPWDQKKEYDQEVECFMDTMSGGLMKIGKKLSLLEVLAGGKTEIVNGLIRIHVLPHALAPAWIDEVKRKSMNQ